MDIETTELQARPVIRLRQSSATFDGDNAEKEIPHLALGHVTGAVELTFPENATGTVDVHQRTEGSSIRGKQINTTALAADRTDAGVSEQLIALPAWSTAELVVYVTVDATGVTGDEVTVVVETSA